MAGIQRGTMSVRMEYDQNGRIISQIFADGKSWSYTYLEKVRRVEVVLLLVCNSPHGKFFTQFARGFFERGQQWLRCTSRRIGRNIIKTCPVHRRCYTLLDGLTVELNLKQL